MPKSMVLIALLSMLSAYHLIPVYGRSDPGKTSTVLNAGYNRAREQRLLLANSHIYVKLECYTKDNTPLDIVVSWTLAEHECWNDGSMSNSVDRLHVEGPKLIVKCPSHLIELPPFELNSTNVVAPVAAAQTTNIQPNNAVVLPGAQSAGAPLAPTTTNATAGADAAKKTADIVTHPLKQTHPLANNPKPVFVIREDGIYEFELIIETASLSDYFTAPVNVEILGPHGYISATDYPLLPFYCIMCIVYVVYGVIWLLVSFMQWRDLLRIQFWIGGVILLGMLEKAFFYAEYNSLNRTGQSVQGAELIAEFVSCAKRTLARMLVIIMSLGFGIVKPRLGPMLHRVVGVGALYFVLACVESYLRVMRTKTDDRNELLVASIPLAVLDTGICWWIFTSLVQTTRTLRLRRNMVKLSLYRHFTNTLIFSVLASVFFMLYALHLRKVENCTPGWKDIWIDTAFWHVLFSVLLLVIMILWRPTNNNQRYAFTPLLDNPEDEDDEEEEDQFVADAYGVKMRGTHMNGSRTPPNQQRATTTEEDDLRWVEENIPSAMAEPALPVLDSDEEIINTKFEVSKMQ